MLDVYVCAGSRELRESTVRSIQSQILIQEYDMKLRTETESPEKLIAAVKESKHMGLYFLDMELSAGISGLEIAKEIRKMDPRGFIVFFTSHSEMIFLTFQYKTEALDFIQKNASQQLQGRICECMAYAWQTYSKITRGSCKTITVTKSRRRFTLEYNEIVFFETSSNEHRLIVHTADESIEFFGKMKDIEHEAGKDFIRCHRGYLVNKKYIKEIDYKNNCIIMKTQACCPISQRMTGRLKKIIYQDLESTFC